MDTFHWGSKSHHGPPNSHAELIAKLRAFDFFARLSPAELERVAACGVMEELPADCLIDEQATEGSSMYFLLSGRVRFWVDDADVRDITLGYVSAPNFFGELCFLSPGLRSTNVTTCSECTLLQVESRDLITLSQLCPDLIGALTGAVVDRCRHNVETLQNTVFRTAKERVMNALLATSRESLGPLGVSRTGRPGADSDLRIIQGYTHEDLASMAFTTRETVTRTLAELEHEGIIEGRSTGWLRIRPALIQAQLKSAGPFQAAVQPRGPARRAAVS